MTTKKEPQFKIGESEKDKDKDKDRGYYGMDPETSLASVQFATTENPYLNEHIQEDSKEYQE